MTKKAAEEGAPSAAGAAPVPMPAPVLPAMPTPRKMNIEEMALELAPRIERMMLCARDEGLAPHAFAFAAGYVIANYVDLLAPGTGETADALVDRFCASFREHVRTARNRRAQQALQQAAQSAGVSAEALQRPN